MGCKGIIAKICSPDHILFFIYAALFLLPLHSWLFYIPILSAALLSILRMLAGRRMDWKTGPLKWPAAGFLICSFLSVWGSADPLFSLFNWCFLPLMYALLYILIQTYVSEDKEKKTALYIFLAGAACVAAWGFFQYADVGGMAHDLHSHGWVDPDRFPLLRRRMFSTLENPNLFGAYLLMIISMLAPFLLEERNRNRKIVFGLFLLVLLVCLALTYSRGAWLSLAAIILGLALFYDKRFGWVFLLIPLILFLYHGQITERFFSLFSGEDTSVSLRFALWESTIAMIEEHPALGIGWGSYWLTYPAYNFFIQDPGVIIFHAHDMYLHIPAEVGLPGGFFYFLLFFGQGVLFWRAWNKETGISRLLGLGGVLLVMSAAVDGIGDYALFSRSVSFCFWALASLSISGRQKVLDK